MNNQWLEDAYRLKQSGIDFVMVSVLAIKGSTPREVGARMLVTAQHTYGTVGGGHLEYKAIQEAQQLLKTNRKDANSNKIITQDYPLGATLGQCCGGFVTLLFETVQQANFHLAVFGAGHVGKAIIHFLSAIPCQVSWIDSRPDEFPNDIADHISTRITDFPVDEVADMPANTYYLILTHNHQLDLELTEAILKRADSAFLGVIGSDTKAARFRHRLRDKGFSKQQINTMHCPMGEAEIKSKQPGEIAIATLSQILKIRQNQSSLLDKETVRENTHISGGNL